MDPDTTLDLLINQGVLTYRERPDTLDIDPAFRDELDDMQEFVRTTDDNDLRTHIQETIYCYDLVDVVDNPGIDDELLGILLTLDRAGDFISTMDIIPVCAIIDAYSRVEPETDGVPHSFLPIPGDRLQGYTTLTKASVAYVWMHDCGPCEGVKTAFEEIFQETPDDIHLFAVYGPEWEDILSELYNVDVAPTTLFFNNGTIDARLYGDHPQPTFETEIRNLRDIALN